MSKIAILIGPPGSGKSTAASRYEADGYVRISQDDQGANHVDHFNLALSKGQNIVIDRMNFDKKQRIKYLAPALEKGYEATAVTFYFNEHTCLQRCLARENHPTITKEEHARSALNTFFSKFEYPTKEEGFHFLTEIRQTPVRVNCVVVDIDGTVADIDHRLHFIKGEKKNFNKFLEACDADSPKNLIYLTAKLLADNTKSQLIFASGRGAEVRGKTEKWLAEHKMMGYYKLFMRRERDYRVDHLIKEMILDFEILTRYQGVTACFDDRSQVVDMWRRRGLTCFQVAEGDF